MHKATLIALSALLLIACTTTGTLKKDDCLTADWTAVGVQDGTQGANSQKILQHAKTCQGLSAPIAKHGNKGDSKD